MRMNKKFLPLVPVLLTICTQACAVSESDKCGECLADIVITDTFCPSAPCATYSSGKGSYLVCIKDVTQSQAVDECLCKGGNLASLESEAAATYVSLIVDNTFTARDTELPVVWIGATDSGTEGAFAWNDGTVWSYSNWQSGEPNDGNGGPDEDCVALCSPLSVTKMACTAAGWTDAPCSAIYPGFVCEVR